MWCGVNLGIANGESCVDHSGSENEVALKTTPRWIGFFVGNLLSDLLKSGGVDSGHAEQALYAGGRWMCPPDRAVVFAGVRASAREIETGFRIE